MNLAGEVVVKGLNYVQQTLSFFTSDTSFLLMYHSWREPMSVRGSHVPQVLVEGTATEYKSLRSPRECQLYRRAVTCDKCQLHWRAVI